MPEVTFYGASDDLVEIEGDAEGCDEYPLGSGDTSEFKVEGGGESMIVVARYARGGTWVFGYGMSEEDLTLPGWPVEARERNSYSMMLTIDAPEGAKVVPLTRGADGEDV